METATGRVVFNPPASASGSDMRARVNSVFDPPPVGGGFVILWRCVVYIFAVLAVMEFASLFGSRYVSSKSFTFFFSR